MPAAIDPTILYHLIEIILFLGIAGLALYNRHVHAATLLTLAGWALVSALLAGFQAAQGAGRLGIFQIEIIQHIQLYVLTALAWSFLLLSLQFLRSEKTLNRLGWAGGTLATLLAVLDQDTALLPAVLWRGYGYILPRQVFTGGALIVLSGLFVLVSLAATLRALSGAIQPLHRNRLLYWLLVTLIFGAGIGFSFTSLALAGSALRLAAGWLALIVAVTHQLPDLRMSMRRTLSYLAITALTLAMYAGGFVIFERMFPQAAANRALWIGAGMALLLAFLFNPLLRLAERLTNRLINGARYDPTQMVHEYSASISNIVDLEKLEQVAVSLILNTLDISHGHLLVVNQKDDGEAYSVAPIQSTDGFAPEPLELCPESPIALYFGSEHRPLTQYDIDLLPRFQPAPEADKAWFKASGLDVYVPVIAQGRWIGMFALGAKQSGNPYSNADLLLLSTLADQTAVALENARLVKDLVQLNHELRSAYDALGRANAHLEKLDKAKTDFINVASHELRTPLTLLSGYGQMLIEEEAIRANPAYQQMIRGIVSGTDRLHEIVDNMLEVAKIDNRALRLDPRPVSLSSLIHQVIAPMEKPVAERRLTLETAGIEDLPSIEADPGALQKVFYHLIVNAIKFTPDGGRIILYGRPVPGAQSPLQKDSVEVVVSDTGIGIDPHNQELVFNKFYQTGEVSLHSTGKTKYKGGGPGLGLAIARGIVEAHAGRIWVESAGYNEKTCPGSHFHILLPATQNGRSLEPTKPAGMIRVQMETWSVTKPN